MDAEGIQHLVEAKVKAAISENNSGLLSSFGDMINKISAPYPTQSISALDLPKFKRRSNEEQFKINRKVMSKLSEAEEKLDKDNVSGTKQAIAEAQHLMKQRQKLVQLADASEQGWRTVDEYVAHPVASDSDDEKRIYKAEARASRKTKTEKSKKRPARTTPYARPRPKSEFPVQPDMYMAPRQRPGLCFQCGKPGHWKAECLQTDRVSNNKISDVCFTGLNEGNGEANITRDARSEAPEAVGISGLVHSKKYLVFVGSYVKTLFLIRSLL